jgi:hypothetical protein
MAAAALKRVVAIETTILLDHTFDLGGKQPLHDPPLDGVRFYHSKSAIDTGPS